MRDKLPKIIAIIALAATVGVAAYLIFSDDGSDGEETAEPASSTGQSPTTGATTGNETADADEESLVETAETFEHAARDWGTDPQKAIDKSNALSDGDTLMAALRYTGDMDRDDLDAAATLETGDGDGPHGSSPWCRYHDDRCDTSSDALDYWLNMDWLLGARILDMDVTVTGEDTVTVSGSSMLIVWTDGDDAAYRGTGDEDAYWAFTPGTATVTWRDTLTIKDGKVVDRTTNGKGGWLADPWYTAWDENPVDIITGLSSFDQSNIPLQGMPPDLLDEYDTAYDGLENQQSTSTDLWEDVPTGEIPDTSCDGCYE